MAQTVKRQSMDSTDSSGGYSYGSAKTSVSYSEDIPLTPLSPFRNGLNANLLRKGNINRNETLGRIDFVLVYRNKDEKFFDNSKARKIFENNLQDEGLLLEYVDSIVNGEYTYVLIYAPWDLLARYAEVMKLRMPMKTIRSNLKILFDEEYNSDSMVFTAPYSRDKEYLFDIPEDREEFFSNSQRAQIVEFVLKRKSFSDDASDVFSMGINKLLSDYVYSAAYPLHEGKLNEDIDSTRNKLINDWASLSCLHKNQPLERILEYFGVKIAIYFAWVGFYTKMLIPASIIGIICFIYSAVTLKYDSPTNQACDTTKDIYMCPICAKNCNYTLLSHSCNYMRASYLFDNPSTVVFAVFMSLWATFYLEMWKRYSAKITYKWDLSDFDAYEEYPRPEYLARLSHRNAKTRINLITRMQEPYIPFIWGKLPHIILSTSLVLLCIVLALGIMVSIIAYRVAVQISIDAYNKDSIFIQKYGSIFTSLTAAFINLICILIFDAIYMRLAFILTEREMPRTLTEFDNSLTLKMFLFQFVNYYSSIFYIAFFKGKFVGRPLNQSNNTFTIVEECPTGGCFIDLAIQLAIIMVGKQTTGAIIEILTPVFMRLYNRWKYTANVEMDSSGGKLDLPQWEEDYVLESWDQTSLFYEYLELVLQFGFVTIFVSAFPLAPVFALINNFFEIRLDAKKFITNYKRPVAQRVKSIGIWYRILDAIGKLSVITNAMIIAFTTSFVPKILYYVENSSLDNYLNSTLSHYEVPKEDSLIINSSYCVFNDYREPPWTQYPEEKYSRTTYYWRLMVARLAFVVVFENIIVLFTSMMRLLIPDVPKKLRLQKRQHSYLTNEIIMRQELRTTKRLSSRL